MHMTEKEISTISKEIFGTDDSDDVSLMRAKNETIFSLRRTQFEAKYPELLEEPFLPHFLDRIKLNVIGK